MISTIPAPLGGKVAIVTGASRGIGEATALEFARLGCSHIAITYLSDKKAADSVLDSIHAIDADIKTTAFPADVRSPSCGKDIVQQALKDLQIDRIDILVSNAGMQDIEDCLPASRMTKENFDLYMTGQAWTPLSLALESIPHMPANGRVILLSSGAGKQGNGDPFINHGASKAAMESIVRNLAVIYGEEKKITVNSIGVGCTDTESLRKSMSKFGPEFVSYCENMSPLKRLGTAQEVASIVSFVATPGASWINGNQIPANGGMLSVLQG